MVKGVLELLLITGAGLLSLVVLIVLWQVMVPVMCVMLFGAFLYKYFKNQEE